MQRPQSFSVRLHLIGFGRSVGGQFRHQSHDGIDLGVYALDLLQMRGKRLAGRQLLGADQAGHLDGAQKTNVGSGGLSPDRALSPDSAVEENRTGHSQQEFAASWIAFIHRSRSLAHSRAHSSSVKFIILARAAADRNYVLEEAREPPRVSDDRLNCGVTRPDATLTGCAV